MKAVILLLPLLSGCLILPFSSTPQSGDPGFELEGLSLSGWHRSGKIQGVAVRMSATLCATKGGVPVVKNKIAFGLYPGYEMHKDAISPVAYGIASPIITCIFLGIPIIDAVLFEPFLSPTDGENVFRTTSPVGFCKYAYSDRTILDITNFAVEVGGKKYHSDAAGTVFIPCAESAYRQGAGIPATLLEVQYQKSAVIENELKSVIGMKMPINCR